MEKSIVIFVLVATFAGISVNGFPADHREDTVLPFSLSPGNVNLETYYLDKYPKPGPGGPLKREPTPPNSPVDGNMFANNGAENAHAIFRTRRAAKPQYYPNHFGSRHQHHQEQIHHESVFSRERHHQHIHSHNNHHRHLNHH